MVQRRVVDLWRQSASGVPAPADWGAQYRSLLDEVARLSTDAAIPDADLRTRLAELVVTQRSQRRPSRASLIRQRLIDAIRPVRSLMAALTKLQWQAKGEHPVVEALDHLRSLYAAGRRRLPDDTSGEGLGTV